MNRLGSSPNVRASAIDCAVPAVRLATHVLHTSLRSDAAPRRSPTTTVRVPTASKTGWSSAIEAAGPDASTVRAACSAGSLVPSTGASTTAMRPDAAAATSCIPREPIVLLCIQTAPSRAAGRNSAATDRTARASKSIVRITSASRTASAGVAAKVAPASINGAAFSALRFQTVTLNPARSSERDIAAPIVPVPSTATRRSAFFWLAESDMTSSIWFVFLTSCTYTVHRVQ